MGVLVAGGKGWAGGKTAPGSRGECEKVLPRIKMYVNVPQTNIGHLLCLGGMGQLGSGPLVTATKRTARAAIKNRHFITLL